MGEYPFPLSYRWLSKSILPILWAELLTLITREPGVFFIKPKSCPVSAKCPKWLVPFWAYNPFFVRKYGVVIIPALFKRTSNLEYFFEKLSVKFFIDSKSIKSSCITSMLPLTLPIFFLAESPFLSDRQAIITSAPFFSKGFYRFVSQPAVASGNNNCFSG